MANRSDATSPVRSPRRVSWVVIVKMARFGAPWPGHPRSHWWRVRRDREEPSAAGVARRGDDAHRSGSVCPPLRESLTWARSSTRSAGSTACRGDAAHRPPGALRPCSRVVGDLPPASNASMTRRLHGIAVFRALDELLRRWASTSSSSRTRTGHRGDVGVPAVLTSRQQSDGPSLVVSYRPEEVDVGSLLLRLTSRLPVGVTSSRIALASGAPDDTASLVSSMLGGDPVSDEFAHVLARADRWGAAGDGGVGPALCDRADIVFRDGQWVRLKVRELRVPPTVRDSTRERVGRLSRRRSRRCEPRRCWPRVIRGHDRGDRRPDGRAARAGIAEAANARVLYGDDGEQWRFRHVLVATAVYEAIARIDRRHFHRGRPGLGVGRSAACRAPRPPLPRGRRRRVLGAVRRAGRRAGHGLG